jgi:hypothetical protein
MKKIRWSTDGVDWILLVIAIGWLVFLAQNWENIH